MAEGVYKIPEQFEEELCKYTGSPFAVAVDNQSNAMLLSLLYENVRGKELSIPSRTYPSVPSMIIMAGAFVKWIPVEGLTLKGAYPLIGSKTWDSALRFTHNMYIPETFMCLSFTGAYKHLKLSKGGAILTDDQKAYEWFKRARFSGRRECSYHCDNFDAIGFNFYMLPELATRGLLLMAQFYDNLTGLPKDNPDVELPYPDLSQFEIYNNREGKMTL